MSLFGRIIVIIFALLMAIVAAGITLAARDLLPEWAGMDSDPVERVSFSLLPFSPPAMSARSRFMPALMVIVISEAARMRNFLYYGIGGALVGLASYYGSDIPCGWKTPPMSRRLATPCNSRPRPGIIGG